MGPEGRGARQERHRFRRRPTGAPSAPEASEVATLTWVGWPDFRDEVLAGAREVSVWCALQVAALAGMVWLVPILWELAIAGAIGGAYWIFFRQPPKPGN